MDEYYEKLLSMVERIAFSVIGLVLAIYLLNFVASLGPGTYGSTLLDGISVYLVLGSVILILWVAYNVFNLGRGYTESRSRKR